MADRERFIPQRVGQTTTKLCSLPWPKDHDGAEQFRSFSRLTSALYHFEFYDQEQIVTEAWERVEDDPEAAAVLVAELTGLLDAANYTPVTMADLDDALANEALIPLRLEVELDDYDELLIYRRGCKQEMVEIPKWMGLRSREKTITVDERVVVYARVKSQSWFDERKIDPSKRNLVPGHISLRQFQNVPRADIEMLLPSTQVGFRLVDSLLIGIPALASGIAVLATKALATFGLIFLLAGSWLGIRDERPDIDQATLVILLGGVIALGGFLFRQWAKLKNRRLEYLKTLTEALYFRTMGAGTGVIHTLLSSAEQQEVVEVLIGYRFLLAASDGLDAKELDARVEKWLRDTGQGDIDFEVDDSIAKLRRLEVIDGEPVMQAMQLPRSLALLDRRWDDLFRYQPTDDLSTLRDGPIVTDEHAYPRLVRLRRVIDRYRGRIGERRSQLEVESRDGTID